MIRIKVIPLKKVILYIEFLIVYLTLFLIVVLLLILGIENQDKIREYVVSFFHESVENSKTDLVEIPNEPILHEEASNQMMDIPNESDDNSFEHFPSNRYLGKAKIL